MRNWRTILLLLVALGLMLLAICTWGSLGSAVCIYGLITMGAALLIKHFLINRDDDIFDSD